MISHTHATFWKAYKKLPKPIQQQAKKTYQQFEQNPNHPSLQFKSIHPSKPVWSVRIGRNWRAVGTRVKKDTIVWFWIGSHEEYNRVTSQL